ncbi:phosphoglycerol transferase MdoB-like AlkP superfamily enzyme [Pontibacter ummariensis]|uniref:Phosphoglycerol transferase MdoB n=1 Tax=Pontibacter ummariensis TaxID=1610492 RepID=A0A239BRH8_9BACT|nr:LTA synthase family protein [Pontibacter ummariensis]PRY15708.1 phosphoglycerol transferase MdoB-like AlkP superfamily enzyme [Pontibacter ummariensis]SNS09644.1 Phosphoglycerol transferase MdoB [Pontibacter ummariensis]
MYFPILYFLFWVFYFFIARAAFLIYHLDQTEQLSLEEVGNTFLYGLRLDSSFAAYVSAIPFFLVLLATAWPRLQVARAVRVYTYFLLVLLTVLLAADLELYTHWGFRLDATPLQYLQTPGEMAASAATAPVFFLGFLTLVLSLCFILLYKRYFDLKFFYIYSNRWVASSYILAMLALLVLPMRGGWQQIPINQSVVYFSDKPYANHAGLNMPWNVMHALLKYNKTSQNPYQYMPAEEAQARVEGLYDAVSDSTVRLVQEGKPNVLFIILESYTAKFMGSLGGERGVTPNLDSLAAAGVSFTNIYSGGDRSEKGMVALLSGYPVQTTTSIIKTPRKTEKLPQLSKVFEQQGYRTGYYYGGELEFANIKSYLRSGGYERLIDKYDFDPSTYNSKWGAHDHVLFERVLQDLEQEQEPFFTTVYTLSSHEPFEIPIPAKFPGTDEEAKFRNSVYYTDWALGRFIAAAKKQAWWDNTLVVIAADHGHPLPGHDANHVPSKFRIPFILSGGALTGKGRQVNTVGAQTDIAATLLAQLNLPHDDFKWSRDLLAATPYPFAFYVFNDGFGFVSPAGVLTYDNVAQKPITRAPGVTDEQVEIGKAYMQYSFEDFVQK